MLLLLSRFSRVRLCATPWTVARQAPLSLGVSSPESWSGSPCPRPGDLPNPGVRAVSILFPALAAGFFSTGCTWEARLVCLMCIEKIINKDPPYSTGDATQSSLMTDMGKESEKKMAICITESLPIYLKLTKHCKSTKLPYKS